MFFVYYWTHEKETGDERMFRFDDYAGDIGDIIKKDGKEYIIDDLSAEYEDFDEPEDY